VASYPDPDEFVLQLNQLLVTLRQVAFMVERQKRRIPGFEPRWNEWDRRMKDDKLMAWLRSARNFVEKEGDLDIASTAKVSIIASWLDGPYREFDVPPLASPDEIASMFEVEDLPEEVRKEGVLSVERRWVARDLPDHEITDVCAYGYGVLSTLLAEAHQHFGFQMRTFSGETHAGKHHRTAHLGGRLPCMLVTREARTAHVHLAKGKLVWLESREVAFEPGDEQRFRERSEAMTIAPTALAPRPGDDPLDWGARWSSVARRTLAHDGFHLPLAFLFDSEGNALSGVRMTFEDQAEKYLAFRRLAGDVDRLGAHTVIVISEMWGASVPIAEIGPRMKRASERTDRTESLVVVVATADGRHRSYHSPFTRDKQGRPVLGETEVIEDKREVFPSLVPLQDVWSRWPRST
jgi:hypothetical protein